MAPAPGTLLIAEPYLPDANFFRAVILLVEHNAGGSLGFVLNHPMPVQVKEVTDYFGEIPNTLYRGGPVEKNKLFVLHAIPQLPDSQKIIEGVYWSADPRALRAVLATRDLPDTVIRFLAGYAGWAPGQLDYELARKAWIVAPARAEYVFFPEPQKLWQKVLSDLGGKYAFLATLPEDPTVN
ncbi:MAG: YqgE/AlgH family protein [Bacteroidia bacterium]|nr:YqgE/AlgH family protein [Bacteroidia bacterium]